jgi:predicted DNA-binding transcriptional regulator AlpA
MQQVFLNPYEVIYNRLQTIENRLAELKPIPPLPPPPADERFLDVKQTSELFGVSTVSIWQWEKLGILQSYRLGNLKRFRYSELLQSPKLIQRTKK